MPQQILIVTPGGLEHGGGIGRVVGYFLDAWRSMNEAPGYSVIDSRGAGHVALSPFHLAICLLRIAIQALRHPIVHVHVAGRGSTLRKLVVVAWCRTLGLDVVLHLHDYNYRRYLLDQPSWLRRRIQAMFRSAQRVLVLGRSDAELVETMLGVPGDRIVVMHNAVPKPTLPSAPDSDPLHLLFLGRLSERKGVHDLIAAFAEPAFAGLRWRATLAGDGDIERFRDLARAAGVISHLTFTGWLDRPGTDRLLADAQILVLPSYEEGMAMSVLEGLANGLCVVCTPVGALAEVIEDGRSGLLCKPGDVPLLATTLARVLTDSDLRRRLRAGARARHRAAFDIEPYAHQLIEIFRQLDPRPKDSVEARKSIPPA
jgi:glycosyltransferase involved in cell wall biosynthesis